MCEQKLFWGLLGLCRSGKVRFLWWAPPCTTFSLARSPKLRSLRAAWGFNLLDEATMLGNIHAVQSLLLALIQWEQGMAFCGEQPAFGFMRGLEPWIALLARGAFEIFFDWCRYGRPFKKTTRLLCNFKALGALGKRCHHHRKHKKLEGSPRLLPGRTLIASASKLLLCVLGLGIPLRLRSPPPSGLVQGDSSGFVEVSGDSCFVGREFRDRLQVGTAEAELYALGSPVIRRLVLAYFHAIPFQRKGPH